MKGKQKEWYLFQIFLHICEEFASHLACASPVDGLIISNILPLADSTHYHQRESLERASPVAQADLA